MPRKDPEAYREYMRNYMREKGNRKKTNKEQFEKMSEDDFNVTQAVLPNKGETLDLNGKAAKTLLETVKKASKDPDTEEEDPVFKYIEKGMKYAPVIIELFKGFSAAAQNFQATQRSAQPQRPSIQPPDGWESMSALTRLNRKYTQPEWYAAGERWEQYKASGGAVQHNYATPINTDYVDPTYNQAIAHRQERNLQELKNKYPEPPLVNDVAPAQERAPTQKPEFVKQAQQKRGEAEPDEEKEAQTMIINAMREDNNKYIELAFNFLNSMDMESFKGYVQNIDTLKPKMVLLNSIIPVQTREMLKNTSSDELVDIFKEKCPEKHAWLKEEKKLPQMKKLFEELKETLQ